MRFSSAIALSSLVGTAPALAFPFPFFTNWRDHAPDSCVPKPVAANLTAGFAKLISAYTDADADRLLTNANFTDWSDSINALAGIPLGAPTFSSKAAFKAGQGAQPPVPLVVECIDAVDCGSIALRWNATFGDPTRGGGRNVKGITILEVVRTGGGAGEGGWQIATIFTEFNSLVWLTNIGGNYTFPAGP